MLTLYWLCFLVAGGFVSLAALGGIDGLDFDHELPDLDVPDPAFPKAQSQGWQWLSLLTSLKFWTFGLCFFGLTGLLLTFWSPSLSSLGVLLGAIAMGLLLGSLMAGTLRSLRQRQVDSLIRSSDLVGQSGCVTLPFDRFSRGKVCLMLKGSRIELIAQTEEPRSFTVGDGVTVLRLEGNRLWVIANDQFDRPTPAQGNPR
jgi:membrane protein implicated in regulation of membrane protease activity